MYTHYLNEEGWLLKNDAHVDTSTAPNSQLTDFPVLINESYAVLREEVTYELVES